MLGSKIRHFSFEPEDRDFITHCGAVLLGSFLRRRLLEADAAKLHFLSQISHELRTPLHGAGSYIEMCREVADPEALACISASTFPSPSSFRMTEVPHSLLLRPPPLDGGRLRLLAPGGLGLGSHFFGLANSEVSSSNATIAPPTTTVDLESIVVAVVQSVWAGARFKRSALEAAAEYSALQAPTTPLGSPGKVDLILEYNLPPGTTAQVDVGALTRVLSNLIGNAHKHTSNGSIVVVVSTPSQSIGGGTTQVHIDVADTGSSFSPSPPPYFSFASRLRSPTPV